jgi:hypothetical protein
MRERRRLERQLNRVHLPKHPSKARRHAIARALSRLFHRIEDQTEPLRVEWLGADGTAVEVTPRPHHHGGSIGVLSTLL